MDGAGAGIMSTGLLTVRVERRDNQAEGICSYELVSVDGTPLPAFTAGAHIDVHARGWCASTRCAIRRTSATAT
jgi:hypothetical protein